MLDKDWKRLFYTAYSMWAFYLLAVVTIAPDVLFFAFEIDTNPMVWGRLQIAIIIGGVIGRIILQPKDGAWVRRILVCVVLLFTLMITVPVMAMGQTPTKKDTVAETFDEVAFDLISKWEGKRNHSYRDIVGVWTICYGHTRTAGPNQWKSDLQCKNLLIDEITEYREGLHKYFTNTTIENRLTPHRDAAYSSLAFNVGIRGAGRSTATKRLNRGDVRGGCEALTWWNKAGGRVVRGLVRRRSEEREYCLIGL